MISGPILFGDDPIYDEARLEWVTPQKGIHLRLAIWEGGNEGTVHIFTGRTEYIEKYTNLIKSLIARGFSVTCHDWRGQGMSTRNARFPNRCHIDDFAEFQNDASAIMQVCKDLPAPRHLFCHSMGGCIGARFLMGKHNIKSAVFSAPMWGVYVPMIYRPFQKWIKKWGERPGNEWTLLPGFKEQAYEAYEPYWKNQLTTDKENYRELKTRMKLFPELGLGGPTFSWYGAAKSEIDALETLEFPNVPSLVFVGSKEKIIDPKAIELISNRSKAIRLVKIKGAKHEIYLESEPIVKEMWSHIDSFWLSH